MMLTTLQRYEFSARISGYRGGTGPAMVLIHGVGLCADAWGAMIPFLEKHFSLSVLDMPGHGESPCFSESPQLKDYTNAIAEVLSGMDGPSIVVGHSMGALISMDLAIRHPNLISAIAPLNAVFRRSSSAKRSVIERAADIQKNGAADPSATLARWFGKRPTGILKAASDQCRQWLIKVDPMGYSHAYGVFANEDGPEESQLRSIGCPALFMTGAEEPNSTPEMSRTLADLVSRGSIIIVPEARHMMPMTHPEIVSKFLIDWHANSEVAHAGS